MEKITKVRLENNSLSFGGNQGWFCDEVLRKYGCGLVSCVDIAICAKGKTDEISKQDYLEFSKELSEKYFKVRKYVGLNGISMARGLNRFFKKNNLPYKAKWGTGRGKILAEIERILDEDIPVCLSVGPNLYKKDCGVSFYSKPLRKLAVRENVCDHYVTVTGVLKNDDVWLEISSWGKKFYMNFSDYINYKRKFLAFFSNILVIKKRK